MTKVFCDREHLMISIQGHAGAGTVGTDIVCAAISALSFAFEASVTADEQMNASCSRDRLNAVFTAECYPTSLARERCAAMLTVLLSGLELLERDYPEHISIEHKDLRYFI